MTQKRVNSYIITKKYNPSNGGCSGYYIKFKPAC